MNKATFLLAFLLSLVLITSCKKEESHQDDHDHQEENTSLEYSIKTHSPNTDDKHIGDTIHIHVAFESATKQTVHHAKVRIFNKADNTEVYNKPDDAHVHQTNGSFELHDDFILSNANGIIEHSDWVLEARVWGHETGKGEVIKTTEFHVHP